jgi:hypothetical protein
MNGEVQLIVKTQSIPQSETGSESLGFSISAGQDYFLTGVTPPIADFYPVGTKVVFFDNNVFPAAIVTTTYVTSVDDALSRVYVSPVLPAINAAGIDVYSYAPQTIDTYLDLFENESISQNWRFTDLNNFQSLGAFSREFRVPFSTRNQDALGALFDVNVDAGSANFFHYKLPAEIRVDTLPIASGYIRVRKVYRQQGKINEVELAFYAETPDLVKKIGEKKLKDIQDLPNLNEVIEYDTVTAASSNRIWTILERGQLWSEGGELNTRRLFDFDNPVNPADLTPALRYDYVFEQIIKDAGFELVGGTLLTILSTYYMPWLNSRRNIATDSYNEYFFRAYNDTAFTLSTGSQVVDVNTEIFDNGGDFDPTTAAYTVPFNGFYTFHIRNKFTAVANNTVRYYLEIDGVMQFVNNFQVANDYILDFTYRIRLNAGSVVKFMLGKFGNDAVTLVAGDGTFETSIFELIQTEFAYGQTIFYDLNAPDVKQIDFITDVIKMHNCVIVPDRLIPNRIYIVPQTSYLGSGEVKDWTSKLDISKDIVLSSTVEIQKNKFQFTYTAGEDIISKQYKNVNRVYGDYEAVGYTINPDTAPSDFTSGDQKIQLVTQSTPCGVVNGSSTVIPMFINEQLQFVAPGMRCLFHAGDANIQLLNDNTGLANVTTTPVLNHYSQVLADIDDEDLNWAPEVPPYGILANPYNNLFNKYWRTYMNALYSPEARIMEASFALDLKDILTFSFADKIWIQDSYWRILEVKDYKVGMNESTSVKLLKFLEDVEDCASTPSTITINGLVNFVDANGDSVPATQDCCTRYGYNWEESNTTCWAFTPSGDSRTNNVSGNSTTPAVIKTPVAEQTRGILNSVINGNDIIIDLNNGNMLAVGTDLTLTKSVEGSTLLGKNVTTNLPGIHIGGGYRNGDPTSTYYGWAQFGTFVLQKQINVLTTGDVFDLDIEGRSGEYIDMPDDTVWSCLLNVTIKDASGAYETSLHHFTLDKIAGLASASAITTLNTIGAIGANVFTFGIDTTTDTDEHRINVTVTGGTYPEGFVITASLQYQQSKTT